VTRWAAGGLALALLVGGAHAARAQVVRLGVEAIGLSYVETSSARRADGQGVGGTVSVRWRRFGLDLNGYTATVDSVPGELAKLTMLQGSARLSFRVAPMVAIEVGGERRSIDPALATQDMSAGSIGVLSEAPLTKLGSIWLRGDYLVNPKFSGGGSAGLAVELGLGLGVGTANGRVRVRAEYTFQRVDRTAAGLDVPMQLTVAKIGIDLGI
jgi:hypothetical protein